VVDFSLMKLLIFAPLLCLWTATYPPHAAAPHAALSRQSGLPEMIRVSSARSASYDETLGMLKDWLHSEGNHQLVPLFAFGDSRSSDLLSACRTESDETANGAFMTLQLLGSRNCQPCADSFSEKHGRPLLACTTRLEDDGGFQRIDRWLATSRTPNGYRCGKEEGWRIDDALVYALILEGSSRSLGLLNRTLALERACAGYRTIERETLERAPALMREAKDIGHDLKIESEGVEQPIRRSAFFLPREHRKTSKVTVLARNNSDNRMLVEVSYACGKACGRGYLVVLQREGAVWQYALIRMAWIT
jgi:hypothetical protein